MKITLVPSTVMGCGPHHYQFASSAVVNDTLAVDAGCLGFYGAAQDQAKIRHVLITHTHIDHVASLPIFIENAYEARTECVTIHGSEDVLKSCQSDLFNGRIWPDFIAMSNGNDRPFLKLSPFEPGQTIELEGLKITCALLNHVVPTAGYLIEDEHSAVAFVSDTGPTDEIWRLANACPKLKAVFLEGCFPNEMGWLADVSKHLTPSMVGEELKKLTRPARVLIVHIKARFQKQILDELKQLNNSSIEIARFAVPYTF